MTKTHRKTIQTKQDTTQLPIVIMAGGKGTRIASINSTVPKPMIPIDGKPILQYEIESLAKQGYVDFTIIVGHLGQQIKDCFGDGKDYGVEINYITEKEPLGTAGALYFLKDKIRTDFLLINGDIIFDVDIERFHQAHRHQSTIATILTHPNSHPYDSAIIIADQNNLVTSWLHKEDPRQWYRNRVNAGLHFFTPAIFQFFPSLQPVDLDREVLQPLINQKQLSVYDSPEYIKDMGTPDRYCQVVDDIKTGKVSAKNLINHQRAIFLDRDSTINQEAGFLTNIDDFQLLPGVSEAIKIINRHGDLAIVATNQPQIARGELTKNQLDEIHHKMETLLGQDGAYLDAIYYCPHHPDAGFPGEIKKYKIECDCRKPKPGMLLQAATDFNIDLKNSWMIGDSDKDVLAGKSAGCHTIQLTKEKKSVADFIVTDLLSAVNKIYESEKEMTKTNYLEELIARYPALTVCKKDIEAAFQILCDCYKQDHKLLIAGNGGSCADANHLVGELMKSFCLPRPLSKETQKKLQNIDKEMGTELANKLQRALPAISLDNHPALNSAYLNDVDGLLTYAQQVNGYGRTGDVFLGISTSGNSKNILYAAVTAKALGLKIIGLAGKTGGQLKQYCDVCICAPETETYKIQEYHLPIYHCLALMVEEKIFKS